MLTRNDDPITAPGDILIANGTDLPRPLSLQRQPGPSGWSSVRKRSGDGALGDQLAAAGWSFFFLAGAVKITSFGFDKRAMVNSAVKRLVAVTKLQKCNCLQIEDVVSRSFLGLHYVTVSAHSRDIQKSPVIPMIDPGTHGPGRNRLSDGTQNAI
jgi:hypothetical protein